MTIAWACAVCALGLFGTPTDGAELKTKDGNMNVELGDGKRFCVVSGGKATCVDELALESEVRDAVSQSKVLADKHAAASANELAAQRLVLQSMNESIAQRLAKLEVACDYGNEFKTAAGVCRALTSCKAGESFQVQAATVFTDRRCKPLTKCVQAKQYQLVPPGTFNDRTCVPVSECNLDKEYIAAKPTSTSDRVCKPLTLCVLGVTYASKKPARGEDRKCVAVTKCKTSQVILKPATLTADLKCGNNGAKDSPFGSCAEATKSGKFWVKVNGGQAIQTHCMLHSKTEWTLAGKVYGGHNDFSPRSTTWGSTSTYNPNVDPTANGRSMKNLMWLQMPAKKLMVCFTGLGRGCVEFPLKDSKRNYIGKTLQWIFASGKSIHNGIHIQKFAGESGFGGSYIANSYWCGINKGACGSQCGCSGGGRLSDRNDRNPDNLNRGWAVRIGCISDGSGGHYHHMDDGAVGLGVTNCGDGGGCCGIVNSKNMAMRDNSRYGTHQYFRYTAFIYVA